MGETRQCASVAPQAETAWGGPMDHGVGYLTYSGDDFDTVVELYRRRVFSAIYRRIGNCDDAEDLTQEAFVKAYRAYDRFRGDAEVYTWLYRIAVNVCNRRFQQGRRESCLCMESLDQPVLGEDGPMQREVPDETFNPLRALEATEMRDVIHQAVQDLRPEYRVPIVLRESGLSYAVIAETMDIPVGTVKTRILRGRGLLRQRLGSYLGR